MRVVSSEIRVAPSGRAKWILQFTSSASETDELGDSPRAIRSQPAVPPPVAFCRRKEPLNGWHSRGALFMADPVEHGFQRAAFRLPRRERIHIHRAIHAISPPTATS